MTQSEASLRVATWNLWWRHGEVDVRAPAILETLRGLDADIVGLQEVCSLDPDQPRWLRDQFGLEVVVAPDGDDDRFTIVNAIASRWPIIGSEWRYLDVGDMANHRTVLWARVDAPLGPVDVYTTHLSHGFDQSGLRQRQLAEIAAWVSDNRPADGSGFPPILLGDLNAVPDSDEIRQLTGRAAPAVSGLVFSDAWEHAGRGAGITYSEANPHVTASAWPERRLDYVLVGWPRQRPSGNPVSAEVFGVDPVGGTVGSDHYGVVVDLCK